MSKNIRTKPISLRFSSEIRDTVKGLSDGSGFTQAQLYEVILKAACKAIAKNDYEMSIHLEFEIKN